MKNLKKDFIDMDATDIATEIKEGRATCLEVLQAYIDHVNKVKPSINAIVEDRFTQALEEAEQLDEQFDLILDKGPLFGVPISVKESFHVKGMKTTGGLIHRQDLISTEDAAVVATLKTAGAIIIGKTNTPSLCFCQETNNKLYGRTNNSWDIAKTAGGSSGGEGALLGVGGSAVGIGSDIGGSIRFPSHFNGVIGFKPGHSLVDSTGHFPADEIPIQNRMSGMGPMGKSVRDIELLYKLIANNRPPTKSLDEIKINILPGETGYPLSNKTKEILDSITLALSESYDTERIVPPFFADSAQLWQEIMSIDGGEKIKKLAFHTDRPNLLATYLKEKTTTKTDTHAYLSWALIGANLFKPSNKRAKEIETILAGGDLELVDYLENRLLIFPVYHTGATNHGKVYSEIFSIRKTFRKYMPYVAYANVWGLPSLTVPVSTDEDNLPLSIQIISCSGNEDIIFKLGKRLESKFRGYVRSMNYD